MLYGNGVTKNFLSILETERDRNRRKVVKLAILTCIVIGLSALFLQATIAAGLATVAGFLAAGATLGILYAQFVSLPTYNESIRGHWNDWMRHSVTCLSVRECFRKVHKQGPGLRIGWLIAFLTGLLLAHLVLIALALNAAGAFWPTLAFFALDASLVGFFLGRRLMERRWYKRFLQGVHDLLREGRLGVWGVW